MISMTRIPLILLMLSSCSIISYGELPELAKGAILGVDIEVTKEFYDSQPYSFAKINIGKSIVATIILAKVQNGTYLWISADGERIYTRDGKIIRTEGLNNDSKILNLIDLDRFSFANFHSTPTKARTIMLQLSNPHAIVSQSFYIKEIGIDSSYFNSMLYEESFDSGRLAWEEINRYWVDPRGRVMKSEQYIHPRLPKITIEFFYK